MSIPTEWLGPIEEAVSNGVLVAWDGCHKMYVAMDPESGDDFRDLEYPHIVQSDFDTMMNTLHDWWDKSCELRFIQSMSNGGNDCDDFDDLIPQFAESSPF
jgi:hypothetical protein